MAYISIHVNQISNLKHTCYSVVLFAVYISALVLAADHLGDSTVQMAAWRHKASPLLQFKAVIYAYALFQGKKTILVGLPDAG